MTRYTITATASAVIPASATVIFDLIAEYLQQHPRIQPPEHFTFLAVDSGGWSYLTRVTIETMYQRPGLGGLLERLVVPCFLRRLYDADLDLLAREATGAAAPSI